MNWQSVLSGIGGTVLNTVLPGLAGLVGGKMGEKAAEVVGGMIAEQLGVDPTPEAVANAPRTDVEDAAKAISEDPAKITALASLMAEETKRLQVQLADVQDARRLMTVMQGRGSIVQYMPAILSIMIAVAFFGALVAMFFFRLPESNIVMMLIGALISEFRGSMGFWFSSSASSKSKDETLSAAVKRMGG